MSPLRLCLLLVATSLASQALPKPPHDIWLEGEDCPERGAAVVGRHPNFSSCYGSAILQLQTQNQAPPNGHEALFRAAIPEAGWWEVRMATTPPSLCPFSVQIGDNREHRFSSLQSEQRYGHSKLFGWYLLGRFQLPAGETTIAFRARDRRGTEHDYLLYVDALALRRVAAPEDDPRHWLSPADEHEAVLTTTFSAPHTQTPAISLCCDGTVAVELNGESIGTVTDAAEPWHGLPERPLKPDGNTLRLTLAPGKDRAVVAWVTADGERGERPIVCATNSNWQGNAQERGTIHSAPWGDLTIFPPPRLPFGKLPIPVKTGNLSVNLLQEAARGRQRPKPKPLEQLPQWRDFGGISSVEDYICWLPAEPERDHFDWSFYANNCRELERQGMGYTVYPWLHFAPQWALASELWEPLLCNQHSKSTYAPSVWAPATRLLFDRFYRELHREFGNRISQVYLGVVADYGEIGYPIGMAKWVVPSDHVHAGFWCADTYAQADFRQQMLARYADLPALNRAWGTAFPDAAQIEFPPGLDGAGPDQKWLAKPLNRRRWLDFVDWYYLSMERFCEEAVGISRRYFPDQPHELKIGFGSETVRFGSDPTLYVSRSRAGRFTVRSTHGKLSPYFYRRFSTAAKFYNVPLVTEPPSGVSREEEVERIFKEATCGTTEFFDYPNNLLQASDLFRRFGPYMEGHHSLTNLAFFMPSTDLRLHPEEGNPKELVPLANACRDLFDWDLLDERLICDGALPGYGVLIVVGGCVVERDVLAAMDKWVRAGGVLVALGQNPIETVEGDRQLAASWFVPDEQLPSSDELRIPHGTPLPACYIPIGEPNDEPYLAGDWHNRESGHWEWGGAPNKIRKRWTGAHPRLLIPAVPGKRQHLAIAVARHPKLLDRPCEVRVNGQPVGTVATTRTSVFQAELPASAVPPDGLLRVELAPFSWLPSEVDGSTDTRRLGVGVRWVKVWQDGQAEPTAPCLPELSWQTDVTGLLPHLHKQVGKGITLRLPIDPGRQDTCTQLLGHVLSSKTGIVPDSSQWPDLDGHQDGVWTALLPNRVLFYNPGSQAVPIDLPLDPAAFARAGLPAPAKPRLQLSIPAGALASVELPDCTVRCP